jgi:hypothetical protein
LLSFPRAPIFIPLRTQALAGGDKPRRYFGGGAFISFPFRRALCACSLFFPPSVISNFPLPHACRGIVPPSRDDDGSDFPLPDSPSSFSPCAVNRESNACSQSSHLHLLLTFSPSFFCSPSHLPIFSPSFFRLPHSAFTSFPLPHACRGIVRPSRDDDGSDFPPFFFPSSAFQLPTSSPFSVRPSLHHPASKPLRAGINPAATLEAVLSFLFPSAVSRTSASHFRIPTSHFQSLSPCAHLYTIAHPSPCGRG